MNETTFAALSPDFEQQLYKAAHQNLADNQNPLRLSNFAYAMRELVRHMLERLAPTEAVTACSWYQNETTKADGVTRRQRAYYAVQGGLSNEYVQNVLGLKTQGIHQTLIKAIDRLSKFTHIQPEVFSVSAEEIDILANQTEQAVEDLILAISECRKQVASALWHHIDEAVVFEVIRESIGAIDEIATHHCIDEIYVGEVNVTEITHDNVFFKATGSLGAELQWGSSSDVKNDIGAVMSENFSFECQLMSLVAAPDELEVTENSLAVDTSNWSNMHGEDEMQ